MRSASRWGLKRPAGRERATDRGRAPAATGGRPPAARRIAVLAGGQIVTSDNKVVIGPSTRQAASIMHRLATSPAADPSLNTSMEDQARVAFEKGTAAFEINYPFVWPAAAAAGIQKKMGYAPFQTVTPGTQPRVSIGGHNLAVSSYSKYPQQAFDAIRCLTQPANQVRDAIKGGLAPVTASVYDEPAIAAQYPFHALLKAQIEHYGIRPKTPAYADVSLPRSSTSASTSNPRGFPPGSSRNSPTTPAPPICPRRRAARSSLAWRQPARYARRRKPNCGSTPSTCTCSTRRPVSRCLPQAPTVPGRRRLLHLLAPKSRRQRRRAS